MNPITVQQVKKLILKTLERRHAVTDRDLAQIPEIAAMAKDQLPKLLDEMVDNKDIMFLEFLNDDKPGTVHTIYFPNGTAVFEPGLSIKHKVLPDVVHDFFMNMMKRGVIEQEFFDALDREGKINWYQAIHAFVQTVGSVPRKLNREETNNILKRLVVEGKVTLRREDHIE